MSKAEIIALIAALGTLFGAIVAFINWYTRPDPLLPPIHILKLIVQDESQAPLSNVPIKFKGEKAKEDFTDTTDTNGEVKFSTSSTTAKVSLLENSPYKIKGALPELTLSPQSYSEKRIALIKKNNPPSNKTHIKIDETLISLLENSLQKQQWKEADKQTAIVMLQAAGLKYGNYLNRSQMERFGCQDINRIDDLWLKYSNHKFGFSVQKQIFKDVGGDFNKFGDRVGWRNGDSLTYNKLNFSLGAPDGHLPSIWLKDPEDKKKLSGGWIAYNLLSDKFSNVSKCLKPVFSSYHEAEKAFQSITLQNLTESNSSMYFHNVALEHLTIFLPALSDKRA